MTWTASPDDPHRRSRCWGVVAVALLLIALGCLAGVLRGRQDPQPADADRARVATDADHARVPVADGARQAPPPSAVTDSVVARVAPVSLRLPAIDVEASVSPLGLNTDGTVQVPADPDETGWFRRGPSPGQVGSAVILGHVDSLVGPAVFIGLRTLQAGDLVAVRLADGSVARFAVIKVRTYPNEQFPARKVYASHGYSGLQLVTCGGEYDSENGGYQSNVVVYTSLVSTTTPHA